MIGCGRPGGAPCEIRLKRVYQPPQPSDGLRILVDRLWPRGMKAGAGIDLWLKNIAPSDYLRRWFGQDPARWPEFRLRYRAELEAFPAPRLLLEQELRRGTVTLLFAARDELHNNAAVLKEMLEEDMAFPKRRPAPAETPARHAPPASRP